MEKLNLIQQIAASLSAMGICMIVHVLFNHSNQILKELGYDKPAKKLRSGHIIESEVISE